MTVHAKGYFEIETAPEGTFGDGIGRFSLRKIFHGDLEGSGVGEMLAVRTRTPGSAGYVLIEHIVGTLDGKSGTFMLQHHGLMSRSQPDLEVVVIPDSGTGELEGIEGKMSIDAAANHAYVLEYSVSIKPLMPGPSKT